MSKLDWHHIIHVFHFFGLALLLSQPVTALLVWATEPRNDLPTSLKFAQLLGRMDRVAQVGLGILIVSGIGQIWAHNIGPGDIFTDQLWLGIKLVLVALLVLGGFFLASPAIRARIKLLQAAVGSAEVAGEDGANAGGSRAGTQLKEAPAMSAQRAALDRSYARMQITGTIMMVLIMAILYMVLFQPFSVAPR